jgi:transposase
MKIISMIRLFGCQESDGGMHYERQWADRIKLLLWDGTGLVLVTKRLETGTFRWPRFGDGVMSLTAAQASALIEGLDWARVHAPRVARPVMAL